LKQKDPEGVYLVRVMVTVNGETLVADTSFVVDGGPARGKSRGSK
jgi:hypothetical protein